MLALSAVPPASPAGAAPAKVLRLGERALRSAAAAAPADSGRWTPYVLDRANRVTLLRPTEAAPWVARMDVRALANRPAPWQVSVTYRNQALQHLEPATDYVLSFRARATTARPLTLDLARHHAPYRNLGLLRDVVVDPVARDYHVHFRTADSLPPLREPESSGVWLTAGAGQGRGTIWIGEAAIAPAERLRYAGRPLTLAAFKPGECWTRGGAQGGATVVADGLELRAPAGGAAFVSRERPLDLSGAACDLVLRVHVSDPARVGRIVVFLRPGSGDGRGFAFQSLSGLASGWNRVAIPRARFQRYTWQGPFSWSDVREVAVRLESNANGDARITLGAITIEPAADARTLPPVVRRLGITHAAGEVRITCETDPAAECRLEFGTTAAYGRTVVAPGPGTRHALVLSGLLPGRTYHARVVARSESGATARTGDFTFVTDPAAPWIPPATTTASLGLFATTEPTDLPHAAASDFDAFSSYRFHSCADSDAEARVYLDAAAAAGGRALMGFCIADVARGDTVRALQRVRALAAHAGLLGWFLFDEPEGRDVDPAALRRVRNAVHRADPAHPVFVVLSTPDALRGYGGAADVAIVDRYPVPFSPLESVLPLLRAARDRGKPFHWTFQSYATDVHRWPGAAPGPGRYPTREEMRALAWLGVVHGASGLWTYAYFYLNDTPGSEWHWADLLTVAREARLLGPLIGAPQPAGVSVSATPAGALHACVREVSGRRYVIAVNAGASPTRGTLRLAGVTNATATDVRERRALRLQRGEWTDTWPAFGLRVYALSD